MVVDINKTLTLDCTFVGFVVSNITWQHNNSEGYLNNTDVSIVNTVQSSSILSVLTWSNVNRAKTQGHYGCIGFYLSSVIHRLFKVVIACKYDDEWRYHSMLKSLLSNLPDTTPSLLLNNVCA